MPLRAAHNAGCGIYWHDSEILFPHPQLDDGQMPQMIEVTPVKGILGKSLTQLSLLLELLELRCTTLHLLCEPRQDLVALFHCMLWLACLVCSSICVCTGVLCVRGGKSRCVIAICPQLPSQPRSYHLCSLLCLLFVSSSVVW